MDTLWSIYRQAGGLHQSPTAPLTTGHTHTVDRNWALDWTDLIASYQSYVGLMDHWTQTLPAGTITHINYDDLVAHTNTTNTRPRSSRAGAGAGTHSQLPKVIMDVFTSLGVRIQPPSLEAVASDTTAQRQGQGSDPATLLPAVLPPIGHWRTYAQYLPDSVLQFSRDSASGGEIQRGTTESHTHDEF